MGLQVRVTDASNALISTGAPALHGSDVTQAVVSQPNPGPYVIAWRVTADDGHVVTGLIHFTIANGGAATRTGDPAPVAKNNAPAAASTGIGPFSLGLGVLVLVVVVVGGLFLFRQRGGREAKVDDGK